jgi:GntR family transcriptional regulator
MDAAFRIDPTDPRPLWRQIEENVRHLVACGALRAAAPVPSVRDLARALAVNPATVAKAYQRLADAGVLAVRRGDGTYVATAPPAFSAEQREERLLAEALRYASVATTLGASPRESAAALEAAWRDLAPMPAPTSGEGDPAAPAAAASPDGPAAAAEPVTTGERRTAPGPAARGDQE